jgi:glycosyltransferase involved in cell wall biosynthesis
MKRIYFWSPHIDPQVATLKSVYNSLNSLIKYGKKFKPTLINVFGEWDKHNFEETNKIDLILSRNLIKRKFKGFFNSRLLYIFIFLLSYFPLKKILKKRQPEYLIIHLITSVPILLFIFNNFRTKLILRISGLPKLNFLRFILWKIVSNKIEHVVCPTEETKNYLLKKKIFKDHQLVFIPDPIIEIKKMNDLKRKNCDDMKKKSYFLSIGRLTKQKNHIFLINFFSKNISYLKNHELIIIGEGELESTCRRIIDDKKLNDKIKILGYKKNVFNYINKAKCIISSSLWEDPGFIMIESAFIGTPVISSDCPSGPKEFIGNNENGFIYKSGDEKSFQKILDNFLNISDRKLFRIIVNAKKKSKIYTRYYNFKKLSYLFN